MPPRPSGAQPPPNPGPPPSRGIAMLGAQQTGKTTFLAALQIALLRKPDLGWSLTGDNPGSTQALISFMNSMSHDHEFPQATVAIENYRWSLEAELPKAIREWHWWGFRRKDLYIRVPLELMDAPGESADGRLLGRALSDRLVENLARSAGIVLFFDPVSEFERGDAFVHSYGVLAQLRSQAARRGRLPHHVAVCITKFDEIRVLESAQKLRVVEYELGREEFPQVPEEYAAEFFNRLIRLSRSDNAGLILPLLEQTFHKERVRFFVTSAIGFYLDPSIGVFDPDDYQNHIPGVPPEPDRIRGAIYPINVIEPVLWLGRNVARTAG
jgi:double-GTPase-like protein